MRVKLELYFQLDSAEMLVLTQTSANLKELKKI